MADTTTQAQYRAYNELHTTTFELGFTGTSSLRPPLPVDVPAGYAVASVRGFQALIAPDGKVDIIVEDEEATENG